MAGLTILTWHNVGPTWCFPAAPGRGAAGMAAQFRALSRFANVVPLEEGLDRLADGQRLPRRAVAITFDDGYRDTLSDVAPLLRRYRLHATVFLVPGLLSGTCDPWWETLSGIVGRATVPQLRWRDETLAIPADPTLRRPVAEILLRRVKDLTASGRSEAIEELSALLAPAPNPRPERLFMDWDEARRLSREGTVAIGSHSLAHVVLANETPDTQRHDLTESRRILERELDVPIRTVSYPVGTRDDYNATTLAGARAAGYAYGLTTGERVVRPGFAPLEVPRFVMSPERGLPGFLTTARPRLRRLRTGLLRRAAV